MNHGRATGGSDVLLCVLMTQRSLLARSSGPALVL
jgi:hypothetical protein